MTNLPTPELQAAVERVTTDLDVTCPEGSKWSNALVSKADLRLILAALEARGKALEPFAAIGKELSTNLSDDHKNTMAWAVPSVGDFRRALTVLGGTADV